ncbi:isocitrate lyase/PEP mutase family protein [Paracoccus aminophilus]|uniref:PEP phosphonomutase n=1 Tax=Paracoccus aminophilus JCM 7686 TaxID=1367847 RepID=S5Y043_PARAH|nr:isocitrate lyase/phosphoenolpyruvate mutase family protein [Paracoccus aminophilus]AGT10912.1 PEP phosphonomutase [Paracoccus aminophilus JCM 7686]
MSSHRDKAQLFHSLHKPSDPVILYNIWDAGSAAAVARAGAKAIATGSWSVAGAQGYKDGQALPLEEALVIAARIVASVDLPVTVDFEGGYAADPQAVGENVRRLLELGVVGLNFEDQIVAGTGLHSVSDQVARVSAVRRAADALGVPAFVNARTDVFLKAAPEADPAALRDEAIARGKAYAEAGADGIFVPGLTDRALIAEICTALALPVNVMMPDDPAGLREVAALGVGRVSLGPAPYRSMIAALEEKARGFY